MTGWPQDELSRIAETDDLCISPFRAYGVTAEISNVFGQSQSMTLSA